MTGGGVDAPVSFAHDIKPLFRERDRHAMLFLFDLWSREDVSRNATRILPAVRAGTMPCDEDWADAKVELFARWIAAGTPA